MARISVIVPVYKVEKYLRRCVDSILAQQHKDLEVILVDDGSPDGCGAICDNYAAEDSRIRVVHQQNGGLSAARNTGLSMATGDYIAFVDSDDYVEPAMYGELLRLARAHNASVVYANYYKEWADGTLHKVIPFQQERVFSGREQVDRYMLDLVGTPPDEKKDSLYGSSVWKGLYDGCLIRENGLLFLSERVYVSEDTLFNIDVLEKASTVAVSPRYYYHYCENTVSLTQRYNEMRFLMEKTLYQAVNQRLSVRFEEAAYRLRTDRLLISRARLAVVGEIRHWLRENDREKMAERTAAICRDPILTPIYQRYPARRLPFKQYIFFQLMKRRLTGVMVLVVLANGRR